MRAALTYNELLNGCPTNRARFSLPIIHPKIILKVAAAIDPVEAGAVAEDAFLEGGLNRGVQAFGLFSRDGIGEHQRMQFGAMQ